MDYNNELELMKDEMIKAYEQKYYLDNKDTDMEISTFMVLDIETTLTGEIIQIAYNIYECESFNLLKSFNKIINEGINKVDYYGKFTVEYIIENGHSPLIVLIEMLQDINNTHAIIGHNISFDLNKIYGYYKKYNIPLTYKPKSICTMYNTRYICCVKNKRGLIKVPKLSELYFHCFERLPDENLAHSANYDVEITFECFEYLYKRGSITF